MLGWRAPITLKYFFILERKSSQKEQLFWLSVLLISEVDFAFGNCTCICTEQKLSTFKYEEDIGISHCVPLLL